MVAEVALEYAVKNADLSLLLIYYMTTTSWLEPNL